MLAALFLAAAPSAVGRPAQCSPTRVLFYTSSDWARLSQGLAADPSSCAQYFISIDPLTANKTVMRPNAAARVDSLGPNFHALAEVNYTAWKNWVASTGNSWVAAGQAARASMQAAGFNAANGDTWAINELPSAVRTNTGGARQDAEQLVAGLCDGNGSDSPEPGVVFTIGVGQNGTTLPQYKATLESWFQDDTFWTTMSGCVSDFLFEAYGDIRNYAVAGETPSARVDDLNAFLQAPFQLVSAPNAPASTATARTFLQAAYGPLANASWAWASKYGWTQAGSDVMADYVSAQTSAMRVFGSGARIGFAWNPLNTEGLTGDDFNTQVGAILARLAGSIQETDAGDPTQACEATSCAAVLPGAARVGGWNGFSSWAPTVAEFTSAPQALAAQTPSDEITVELETGAVATTLPVDTTVTVSSSEQAAFALSPGGPWTPTLTLSIPAGTRIADFYALDESGAALTIDTAVDGALTAQAESAVTPPPAPPPAALPLAQISGLTLTPERDHMHLDLQVTGAAGQPLQAHLRLALLVGPTTLATTTTTASPTGQLSLTAAPRIQRGCYHVVVTALSYPGYQWNGQSPRQTECVTTLPAEIGPLTLSTRDDHLHIHARASTDSGQPLQARITVAYRVGNSTSIPVTSRSSTTGALDVTVARPLQTGCYRATVTNLTAPGYSWNHTSPDASYCVRRPVVAAKQPPHRPPHRQAA